jgi:hypothetical protein
LTGRPAEGTVAPPYTARCTMPPGGAQHEMTVATHQEGELASVQEQISPQHLVHVQPPGAVALVGEPGARLSPSGCSARGSYQGMRRQARTSGVPKAACNRHAVAKHGAVFTRCDPSKSTTGPLEGRGPTM